ncbi:class I SAM-dependent methyltransferase [Rhodococcus kroppenstedtii]|uniref:Class I SAM-dependent methyltransferase n=1 Tax=Rhodococcoides kroppenstedtii TaxID=293050 RepID=A0A1I0U8R0_9NOCA|nr:MULTISPECIES: class I SAM-dependent methyltransferase [Rhodococcus]AMY18768.1 putative methyltransferase YcgJ [Rhodococcus sp. PBTS 1]MBY6313039.1 class I SAM-dependent methyltransferase [Rhodococcus kroppenstedtii]MBY6320429.1 class I SAM-dependent methyltransferase [Rhodococcus kroppenstedtii]MBY6399248.1 class I SAM-dependent methyltransferase [Rhodococcus kroppenstedtii]MBY6434929.1 class I SAM-dependent methyltransferase [Rhodococcus kroppenstedtii]
MPRSSEHRPAVVPSPNIWRWPDVYEAENRAQDPDGVVEGVLREVAPWTGRDVVDVGCGAGFHLPMFAADARSVVGVEPHPPLVERARRRTAHLTHVRVSEGRADALPQGDASVDVVHARTAYFFGPGCGPGIAEAMRVLRPGGALVIVDLDATVPPYGDWMRRDLPRYDPAAVERFFAAQGFDDRRVRTRWVFDDRRTLDAVLGIEFSRAVADRARREITGTTVEVGYRIHVRRRTTLDRGRRTTV